MQTTPVLTSHGRPGWNEVTVCEWNIGEIDDYELAPMSELIIALHTGGEVWTRTDRGWSRERSIPGLLHVIPPAYPPAYRVRGGLRFVSIHVPRSRIASLLEHLPAERSARLEFRFAFSDPFVAATIPCVAGELLAPEQAGSLYADLLVDALTVHLLRGNVPTSPPPPARGLSSVALRLVHDRMEASLREGVSLADLAREVGLSRFHFARAFKAATGLPPHQYLTTRRVERAKQLLLHTDLPICDVALESGFGSQSHLSERFRRTTGQTPLRFRRNR